MANIKLVNTLISHGGLSFLLGRIHIGVRSFAGGLFRFKRQKLIAHNPSDPPPALIINAETATLITSPTGRRLLVELQVSLDLDSTEMKQNPKLKNALETYISNLNETSSSETEGLKYSEM